VFGAREFPSLVCCDFCGIGCAAKSNSQSRRRYQQRARRREITMHHWSPHKIPIERFLLIAPLRIAGANILPSPWQATDVFVEKYLGLRVLRCAVGWISSITQKCLSLNKPRLLIGRGDRLQVVRRGSRIVHPLPQQLAAVDHIDG
jgi:hypothetical protein